MVRALVLRLVVVSGGEYIDGEPLGGADGAKSPKFMVDKGVRRETVMKSRCVHLLQVDSPTLASVLSCRL